MRRKFGAHIKDVILFGSRARGDFDQDSDYDVIVLVDKKTPELSDQIGDLAWEIGLQRNAWISVLVHDSERFDRDKYEPLFMNVRKEGVRV
ncbi:MAG: nucleotidyltransferase domain-containing protein [Chloroflexi bacterium]|nr:nucleotidyltransferase domain-containing protein [Chloroflexota bacterium]